MRHGGQVLVNDAVFHGLHAAIGAYDGPAVVFNYVLTRLPDRLDREDALALENGLTAGQLMLLGKAEIEAMRGGPVFEWFQAAIFPPGVKVINVEPTLAVPEDPAIFLERSRSMCQEPPLKSSYGMPRRRSSLRRAPDLSNGVSYPFCGPTILQIMIFSKSRDITDYPHKIGYYCGIIPGGKLLKRTARGKPGRPYSTPPFPGYDPSKPPGPGWEWKGKGAPGSKPGNWHKSDTRES
jgi:hypothetical protein